MRSEKRRERHAAVAVHKRRKSLAELRLAKAFAKQRRVGVAVHVDKARRQDAARGLDGLERLRT